MRPVKLHFYEGDMTAEGPLAVARFTGYDDYGIPLLVRQKSYDDDPDGFCELERDVMEALHGAVDVVVYSCYEPATFPQINELLHR